MDQIISMRDELAILQEVLPPVQPQASFIRRNAVPIFVGGGIMFLGFLGMLLMIKL